MSDTDTQADIILLEERIKELEGDIVTLNDQGNGLVAQLEKVRQRLATIEAMPIGPRYPHPYPLPQPYPVHPGWIPQPGVIPGTPWYIPPDAKFMGMYYTTKEST